MQYILTEEEYRNFIPKDWYRKEQEKVQLLNDKVMELSQHPCGSSKTTRSFTYYCDHCPIGAFGTRTCTKQQQYSK